MLSECVVTWTLAALFCVVFLILILAMICDELEMVIFVELNRGQTCGFFSVGMTLK
jgi:hypothetical protein